MIADLVKCYAEWPTVALYFKVAAFQDPQRSPYCQEQIEEAKALVEAMSDGEREADWRLWYGDVFGCRLYEESFDLRFYAANYALHCTKPFWTLDEAVILMFGRDPAKLRPRAEWEERSKFSKEFTIARDLLERLRSEKKVTEPVSPSDFVKLARTLGWQLPDALTAELEALGHTLEWPEDRLAALEAEKKRLIDENRGLHAELDTAKKEPPFLRKKSLYRLVLAWAKAHGYDNVNKRNTATATLRGVATGQKLPVSEETILAILRHAEREFPPDPI